MEVVLMDYQSMNLEIVPKHNVPNGKVIKLNLAKNHIQKIEHLDAKILTLDLRANRLQKMENLSHLSNLVMLLLSQNRITKIENFESLSKLQILDLSGNNIVETPQNFGQLAHLRVLNLTNNQITEIPMLIHNRNLKELYLKKNQIHSVQQIQKRLPESIELLHLQNNKIEKSLDVKKLLIFRKLKDVRLDENPMLSSFLEYGINYRPFMFYLITSISNLDGFPISEEEKYLAERLNRISFYNFNFSDLIQEGNESLLIQCLQRYCPSGGTKQTPKKEAIMQELNNTRQGIQSAVDTSIKEELIKLENRIADMMPVVKLIQHQELERKKKASRTILHTFRSYRFRRKMRDLQFEKLYDQYVPLQDYLEAEYTLYIPSSNVSSNSNSIHDIENSAAVIIQKYFRRHLAIRYFQKHLLFTRAATLIQCTWRGYRQRKLLFHSNLGLRSMIQCIKLKKELIMERKAREEISLVVQFLYEEVRQLRQWKDQMMIRK